MSDTITSGVQVSVPAGARRDGQTGSAEVEDRGGHVVGRPVPEDAVSPPGPPSLRTRAEPGVVPDAGGRRPS